MGWEVPQSLPDSCHHLVAKMEGLNSAALALILGQWRGGGAPVRKFFLLLNHSQSPLCVHLEKCKGQRPGSRTPCPPGQDF